jgi:excisionase family DNA binding protein
MQRKEGAFLAIKKKTTKSQEELPRTSSNESVARRLINVEEAAQYLGIKANTVRKKLRLRELPYVKLGGSVRFDVKALDVLIAQHTIEVVE